jgi:RNA polymerase sigma-70 factor (ECF subfamily)
VKVTSIKKALGRRFFDAASYYRLEADCSSLTDEELMIRYQRGDEAAFEEIYGRYSKKIYGFIMRRLTNPDTSAELFQETFLRLHRGRDLYRPEMPFKPWLYTIANNLIRDRFKAKELKIADAPEDEEPENAGGAVPDGSHTLLSFKEAFASLTEEQKEALMLSRFQGLRYEQIAMVMGKSTDAVNQLIQRALRQLRKHADES